MKKIILFIFFTLAFLFQPVFARAQNRDYVIKNFDSHIEVNQDTSLTITEIIQVNFLQNKLGIIRGIPVIYNANGKTINAKFSVISVTDEKNTKYQYTTSKYNQGINIKIGNPNKTLTGQHTYIIKYQISEVFLRYQEHDEVYWNITGHEWDTLIEKASATINSPYASITKAICFAGVFGSQEKNCQVSFDQKNANFTATAGISPGKDFTLVIALDKNNQLRFPGIIQKSGNIIVDNWGYPVALIPLLVILCFWYFKGRDTRFISDNVFYQPEDKKTTVVSPFAREHLPLVYSPINGLTPSQIGTIIDERVNIQDVVAEIVELARLGYLEIKKIETKKLIGKKIDYEFIKKNKDSGQLKDYQNYLWESIFAEGKNEVLLSKLKNNFYSNLASFKQKLYQNLAEEKIFAGNPEKTRAAWLGIAIFSTFAAAFPLFIFSSLTFNFSPFFLLPFAGLGAIIVATKMPRRTAWGHSLYRQTVGLRWYLDKGKWREEIAEKNLFFEEILPLAICLGLVTKLAKEMAALGVEPPSYFIGSNPATFNSDFSHFFSRTSSNLVSSPGNTWSGHSSWSGGSGFSGGGGGSSGGGFGGGGGGSW